MNQSYCATIEVARSPEHVFDRLTEVSKWWSKDCEGHSARPHDEFVIRYAGGSYSKLRLTDVVPNRRMEWLVADSSLTFFKEPSEWANTKMVFELTPNGDTTIVHFTHDGLVAEKECYAMCASGWEKVIKESLFNYIVADSAS